MVASNRWSSEDGEHNDSPQDSLTFSIPNEIPDDFTMSASQQATLRQILRQLCFMSLKGKAFVTPAELINFIEDEAHSAFARIK